MDGTQLSTTTQHVYIGMFPAQLCPNYVMYLLNRVSQSVVLKEMHGYYLHVGTRYVTGLLGVGKVSSFVKA